MRRKRELVLRETGYLACEACGFDFAKKYGPHGEGLIEAHHVQPLHNSEWIKNPTSGLGGCVRQLPPHEFILSQNGSRWLS